MKKLGHFWKVHCEILKEIWPYIVSCLASANMRPLPIKNPGYAPPQADRVKTTGVLQIKMVIQIFMEVTILEDTKMNILN